MTTTSSSREAFEADRRERIRRVVLQHVERQRQGMSLSDSQLVARHPDLRPELDRELAKVRRIHRALRAVEQEAYLQALDRLAVDDQDENAPLGSTDGGQEQDEGSQVAARRPARIGRYRIVGVLGEGGFGRVYLGRDDQLQRDVAVKIPWPGRVGGPEDMEAYLAEARMVAALDHPAIVPVYDVGCTERGDTYVVSKRIAGQDLARRLQAERISLAEATRIVLELAGALQHAHDHGLVHRDIKPANILLDTDGHAHLADFGLAIRAGAVLETEPCAGTPAYMSPEQARGETHRIDGRSDIFSLGVVFYEMATGNRPFRAAPRRQLLDQINWESPPPPRRWDAAIPAELERICLRMLAKRAADRYATAAALADDLKMLLATLTRARHQLDPRGAPGADRATGAPPAPPKIVPKGLRAFDAEDAAFYLSLLPGPRDRDGLPDSVRQWKSRIDTRDPNRVFAVGLIYGPSGCGKSSLVRAGLLPRLSPRVQAVYMEASGDHFEERLRRAIARRLGGAPAAVDFPALLAQIRHGDRLAGGAKLLIVLDQFEQWLHGKNDKQRRELLTALRQCDGVHLQCLLLVRDDFWLAVGRFMNELEVDLVQGRNVALVDLFDVDHARNVLIEFGRAYGRIPDRADRLSAEQRLFVRRSTASLAQQGRVVPVRLALFAEMVKDKPWTPATLKRVGGAEGVGVAFLDETFCARTANPECRLHGNAARAVLAALLPEPGQNIRGRVCAARELLDRSGYGMKPRQFNQLMRILDAETRLLTPVDPDAAGLAADAAPPGQRYYQLTHDYLVPSLRQWLVDKQKTTRAGRAKLRLEQRSALWTAQRERRQLPSLIEWVRIRALTRPAQWTDAQRRMMRAAARHHRRLFLLVVLLAGVTLYSGVEVAATARNLLWQVRARISAVLLAAGFDSSVWSLIRQNPDPVVRAALIHQFKPWSVQPGTVVDQCVEEPDPGVRRAMLLITGQLLGAAEKQTARSAELRRGAPFAVALRRIYQADPDPGVHAAARWALQQFEPPETLMQLDLALRGAPDEAGRQWYVNSQGHTMVIVPGPAYFTMGARPAERRALDQPAHVARVRRTYAIASRETTVAQFQRFLDDNPAIAQRRAKYSPGRPSMPQTQVSWYDAAAYCNWLSRQEGMPRDQWCYQPNAAGQFGAGMRVAPDYLKRTGYRLPTEAEWEYACRAGTTTVRFCGDGTAYLERYAVFRGPSGGYFQPVGTLKPNALGLFDMLGNVAEWCLDEARRSSGEVSGGSRSSSSMVVAASMLRSVRGGSYADPPARIRCAARAAARPDARGTTVGFRVARSYRE